MLRAEDESNDFLKKATKEKRAGYGTLKLSKIRDMNRERSKQHKIIIEENDEHRFLSKHKQMKNRKRLQKGYNPRKTQQKYRLAKTPLCVTIPNRNE